MAKPQNESKDTGVQGKPGNSYCKEGPGPQ